MDKATAVAVQKELMDAMTEVLAKRNMKVAFKGGTFNGDAVMMKFEVMSKDGPSPRESAFRAYASSYGLSPDDLGKTFRSNGKTFKITGLEPKKYKRPIVADCDGKSFVFPAEDVKRLLGTA